MLNDLSLQDQYAPAVPRARRKMDTSIVLLLGVGIVIALLSASFVREYLRYHPHLPIIGTAPRDVESEPVAKPALKPYFEITPLEGGSFLLPNQAASERPASEAQPGKTRALALSSDPTRKVGWTCGAPQGDARPACSASH